MLNPPAVSWLVQRSAVHLACVGLLMCLLLAVNLACLQALGFAVAHGVLPVVSLLSVALALNGWYKSPIGILCWTGSRWVWEGFLHNAPASVECALEWPGGALLRLSTPAAPPLWLWIDAGNAERRFSAMRRAWIHREVAAAALASAR